MSDKHTHLWLIIGIIILAFLSLISIHAVTAQAIQPPPTSQPAVLTLAEQIAIKTGIDISLVSQMLDGGIPPEDINAEMAQEWQAHLEILAQREQRRLQNLAAVRSEMPSPEAAPDAPVEEAPSAEEMLWQQIETAHAQGDIETQLSLAEQLPASPDKQHLLDLLSGKSNSQSIPQAGEFIGINGSACAYNTWKQP